MMNVAPLDSWLEELMMKPRATNTPKATGQPIREGERHSSLLSEIGRLWASGIPERAIRSVAHALNRELCAPPLPEREVERMADDIAKKSRNATAADGFPAVSTASALAAMPPAPIGWVMEGISEGSVVGCFANGGTGKSYIELHRAVCLASGEPFFGLPTTKRRVLFFSCEDRINVLRLRLEHICRHLGIGLSSLEGQFYVLDMVGRNAVLFGADFRGTTGITVTFAALADLIERHGIEVLFIDSISDAFGGNENSRGDVKRFVNALLGLIPSDRGAVVLIGHVDKAAVRNGITTEGYSGSSGWNNSLRARWYIFPEMQAGERTGALLLQLQKSNHGRPGLEMRFRWDDKAHLFVGEIVAAATPGERAQRDQAERQAILAAFRECAAAGHYVPAASSGPRTAYAVLSLAKSFPASLRDKARFRLHLEALRQSHEIVESFTRRANGHRTATLVMANEF